MIPDEAVEAAAVAHQDLLSRGGYPKWDELLPGGRPWRLEYMRAALEAAAPFMLSHEREQTRLAHLDAVVNAETASKLESAVDPLLRLADDMEAAMSGGPEFIGRTGLRFNASERIRRILGVEPGTV